MFWRISLLVHPDKCQHEGAAAAFNAVKKAAEVLMNAEARQELDERKRKQAEGNLDRQVAAELEKERQWRLVQGTATAEDLKCDSLQLCRFISLYHPGAVYRLHLTDSIQCS